MHLERFEKLMDGYFDGGLTAAELQELSTVLETDAEARDAFWRLAQTHTALREWGLEQAGLRQFAATDASLENALARPVVGLRGSIGRQAWAYVSDQIRLFSVLAGLAIAATLAFMVVHHGMPRRQNAPVEQDIAGRKPEIPDSGDPQDGMPLFVARLTHVADCRWKDQELAPGSRLNSGQSLHLLSGVAELNFDRGVRVTLQGPALLEIQSADMPG